MDNKYGGVIWTNHAIKRLNERGISQGDAWALGIGQSKVDMLVQKAHGFIIERMEIKGLKLLQRKMKKGNG